jgi:hypothetical protein
MKLVTGVLALALFAPLAIVAIMLGPVILGLLCAAGCALIVIALANLVLGVGAVGRAGLRITRR